MAISANDSFCLRNNSLAGTSSSSETEMRLSDRELVVLTFEALLALLGVIGNISVVIVISRLGKKKQPVDCYVQNLAIADLGILLIALPLVIIRIAMPSTWPFGRFACLYFYPVVEIFYGVSVWCIAVIAIERYQRIVSMKVIGQKSRNKTSLQRAKTNAAGVWVTSFLIFCLPLYFFIDYVHLPGVGTFCGLFKWEKFLATGYMVCLTLLTYLLPLAVISFTNISISRVLKRSSNFVIGMKEVNLVAMSQVDRRVYLTHAKSARLRQNIRAKKILSPLVLTFAVTMLPLNVFRLTMLFWPAFSEKEYYIHLLNSVVVSTIINSAANPVIYSVVSRDFRKGIANLLHHDLCQCHCKMAGTP